MAAAIQASFAQKRVLVTGGANGLGRTLVERLVADNAVVFALDRDAGALEKLKEDFPAVTTLCVDLEDWDGTKSALGTIGPLDHLVNNAGILRFYPFLDIKPEDFKTMYDVNVRSIIVVSQVVAKAMIAAETGGTIVNVSSTASNQTHSAYGLYSCTKASVNMLTKNMAVELSPHNIRVNAVCPTFMETGMVSKRLDEILHAPGGFLQTRSLMKRLLKPSETVDLILFLLSPLSKMMTGEAVVIDGGASITSYKNQGVSECDRVSVIGDPVSFSKVSAGKRHWTLTPQSLFNTVSDGVAKTTPRNR